MPVIPMSLLRMCLTCRYYDPEGLCRFYPAQEDGWPKVKPEDWCGCYEAPPQPPAVKQSWWRRKSSKRGQQNANRSH